jgi:hypothetical protein
MTSDDPTSFAAELDAWTDEMVTGKVGNLRYLIRPADGGKWTVHDTAADDAVIGGPHSSKDAATAAALDLNPGGRPSL